MAMILTSDHKEEKQSRDTVKKAKTCISIDDLVDELLMEILKRVPCKSVFRCKSVSKRWFALISNPYFTHCYHTNKKWRPMKVVLYSGELLMTSQHPEVCFPLNLSFLPCFPTFPAFEVVGSSNGLLLCHTPKDGKQIFCVCNPLTKQWIILPPAPTVQHFVCRSIGFMSYPSHDHSQCSFKVMHLIFDKEHVFKVFTFSSKTGQWKDSLLSCPQGCHPMIMSKPAIYNGMLHWVMHPELKVFSYDLANDKVHAIIDGPKSVDPIYYRNYIGLWRGRMRIGQFLGGVVLKVWELEDYTTGKWRLMHQFNHKDLTWKYDLSPLFAKEYTTRPWDILAFHPYEDLMYLNFSRQIVSCNLQTKTLKFASKHHESWPSVYTLVLPPWPTPVPVLPQDAVIVSDEVA